MGRDADSAALAVDLAQRVPVRIALDPVRPARGAGRSRAVVKNTDLSILPGQFGRVRLIGSAPYEALLIPDVAVATDQSRKIVFVVKPDDTVEARPVVLGPLDEGLRVIRDGLKAEDRVIVNGIQRARVGAKVAPTAAQAPAGGKS